MLLSEARKWIALYFLFTTSAIGIFLLSFSGSALLPLTGAEATSSFQVIIPVFVGQIVIIFQWLANSSHQDQRSKKMSPIPGWAIKTPALLSLGIVIVAALALYMSNDPESGIEASPDTFKSSITFAVTILNASTVFLIGRLFPANT